MAKWKMQEREDSIHVFPLSDEKKHMTASLDDGMKCECNPRIIFYEYTTIVIHNSFDFRELTE